MGIRTVQTIAGIRPQDMGLHMSEQSARPILPNTRDMTLAIPGKNGEWDFGADVEAREFSLVCAFVASDPVALQSRVEVLAKLLVDTYGKPRTVELVFAAHPDRIYTVRYSGSMAIERLAGMGQFTLPLKAFEPYAYGQEHVLEMSVTASPTKLAVESDGEIRTEPKIVLTNLGNTTITRFRVANEYRLEG